jgi:hypothetical protein
MFSISPNVDKVIYSLCTNVTITVSKGVTILYNG